ncbi:hypothetical protein HDE68_004788 [Pedobacter cryoconitis]|uniref:Uncharacterized protein n=1 Tax=Pedobacter cryoconitis TaxID=188932 RepID=A0A7W8ZRG2_9SPHI|nr:hypothetical protein [Pedobacter cryoconitis]
MFIVAIDLLYLIVFMMKFDADGVRRVKMSCYIYDV